MTISGIISVLEAFPSITACLKEIRNIELPLRSITVKQNLPVLQRSFDPLDIYSRQ